MYDEGTIFLLSFLVVAGLLSGYAIKRNFDENALYIQQGYHQVNGTNPIWIK